MKLAAIVLSVVVAVVLGWLLMRPDPPRVIAIDGTVVASPSCVIPVPLLEAETVNVTTYCSIDARIREAMEGLHAADSKAERHLWRVRIVALEVELERALSRI